MIYRFNEASFVTNQEVSPIAAPIKPIISGRLRYMFRCHNEKTHTSIELIKPTAENGTTAQMCLEANEASWDALISVNIRNVAILAVTLRLATSITYQLALMANTVLAIIPLMAERSICITIAKIA
jgi:hypothetical protein